MARSASPVPVGRTEMLGPVVKVGSSRTGFAGMQLINALREAGAGGTFDDYLFAFSSFGRQGDVKTKRFVLGRRPRRGVRSRHGASPFKEGRCATEPDRAST